MGCGGSTPEAAGGGGGGGGGGKEEKYKHVVNLTGQGLTELPSVKANTDSLDCSSNKLAKLPDTIGSLEQLRHLDANENEITTLPESISGCVALQKLYMYKNKMKELPPKLPPALTELNFFNNQIRKLPASIGELSCLEEVNFSSNKLMMTADPMFASWAAVKVLNMYENNLVRFGSLAPLVALEELRLNGNNLEEMPTLGKSHPELLIIEIHKNRIAKISDEYFTSTPALTRLSIWGNQLESFPSSICGCDYLLGLQVQENKLKALPTGRPWPVKLETLFVQENPLTTLPPELTKTAMRRCNVSKTNLDGTSKGVAEGLKSLCTTTSGGIFWSADGSQHKAP